MPQRSKAKSARKPKVSAATAAAAKSRKRRAARQDRLDKRADKRADRTLKKAKALAPRKGKAAAAVQDLVPPSAFLTGHQMVNAPIQVIAHNLIHESPLNPRRHFPPDKQQQLADSIFEKGVLQNILLRPHPKKPGQFEIAAGARRYRAVALNIEEGRLAADYPMPARVVELTDRELVKIAVVENVQRADMHPLEEGEGFAAMRAQGDTTESIAAALNMSQRYVQKRIALVDDLSERAKDSFRAGKMSVWLAETLTKEKDEKRQRGLVTEIEQGNIVGAKRLLERITFNRPPVSRAIFDPALYTGALIAEEDEAASKRSRRQDESDGPWFGDVVQFEALQNKAIDDLEAKLKDAWAWVEIHRGYFESWKFGRSKDKKKAGAVIAVNSRMEVVVHEGLLKPGQAKASKAGAKKKAAKKGASAAVPIEEQAPQITNALLIYAKNRKTEALQQAIAIEGAQGHAKAAMIMVILALMGARDCVKIRQDEIHSHDRVITAYVRSTLEAFRAKLEPVLGKDEDEERSMDEDKSDPTRQDVEWFFRLKDYEDADVVDDRAIDSVQIRALMLLSALPLPDLQALFAALVAARCGSFVNQMPRLGDHGLASTLAGALGIDMAASWAPTGWAGYLAVCKKSRLVRLTVDMPGLMIAPGRAAKMKTAALAAEIQRAVEEHDFLRSKVPAELTFGRAEDIEAVLSGRQPETPEFEYNEDASPAAEDAASGSSQEAPPAKRKRGKKAAQADLAAAE